MKTKTKTFAVASGMIVVGDPCYDTNKSVRAKSGGWTAHVEKTGEGGVWGYRVSKVIVHHEDFDPTDPLIESKNIGFSVDSGQAGVFDHGSYGADGFYDMCCNRTLSSRQCGYLEGGFVSSSGYGDGWYEAEALMVGGVCVCVELTFIEQ